MLGYGPFSLCFAVWIVLAHVRLVAAGRDGVGSHDSTWTSQAKACQQIVYLAALARDWSDDVKRRVGGSRVRGAGEPALLFASFQFCPLFVCAPQYGGVCVTWRFAEYYGVARSSTE